MNSTPNVLVIMYDQLTPAALGCYGSRVTRSPHIDRLAAAGVVFDAAYTNSPLCTPARYCLMTGQLPSSTRGYDNAAYLASTIPTFAHYARAAGYRTVLSGKMHFVGPDQLHGFEERRTTDIYPADFGWTPDWRKPDERIDWWYHNMESVAGAGVAEVTNQLLFDDEVGFHAVRALHDAARADDRRPFLHVASFTHPHDPYVTRQEYWDRYEGVDIPLPEVSAADVDADPHTLRLRAACDMERTPIGNDDVRRARRAYLGNISYVDDWTDRLLQTLESLGLADDTVVILLADHGDMLGERGLWYKMSFFEGSARIPLIVHASRGDAGLAGRRAANPDRIVGRCGDRRRRTAGRSIAAAAVRRFDGRPHRRRRVRGRGRLRPDRHAAPGRLEVRALSSRSRPAVRPRDRPRRAGEPCRPPGADCDRR
jgi:choline-sulfatase